MSTTGSKKKLPSLTQERIKLIEKDNPNISIARQCQLSGVNRSSFYYEPQPVSNWDIWLMNKIDEIYTELPFYGSPKITKELHDHNITVNHKKVERLMRIMGIQAICPKRNTSQSSPENAKYPYLLKGIDINHPNQVWGTDITYVRAKGIWFYLVAILDWHSRYVISWKLSRSLSVDFCVAVLEEALKLAQPEIHNSDQGSQFTAEEYLAILKQHENIQISMDGRGRCFDNIFNERLWRSVKYEEVYLHDYQTYAEANSSLTKYFRVYNQRRLHQALDYQTPAKVYFGDKIMKWEKNEAPECVLSHANLSRRYSVPVGEQNFSTF